MAAMQRVRSSWWGNPFHVAYTIVVFVVLASLDNAAIWLIPSMTKPVIAGTSSSTLAVGVVVSVQTLVLATTAVFWGYAADRSSRKVLLISGTLVWAVSEALATTASSFWQFFGWQILVAAGLGAIASAGFSVISDFVGPARRGLAMSFWGISQGLGAGLGIALASQLGADDFRAPLLVTSALGALFAFLYLFAFEAPRGFREPELQAMYASGDTYEYRMSRDQIRPLLRGRTNRWIIFQGLFAQIAYGSLIWVAFLYQEKVIAQGYSESTATKFGGLLAILFAVGNGFSIIGGYVGDRFQRRTPRGRALVSAVGVFAAIPFFLAFLWIPLRDLEITEGAGTATLLSELATSLVTNPWLAVALLSALLAYGLTSVDSPNGFAMISDVNVPEHRATLFGVRELGNNITRSAGQAAAPALANAAKGLPPPFNWILSLSILQFAFVPAGWGYWMASKTAPGDIAEVAATLTERSERSVDDT